MRFSSVNTDALTRVSSALDRDDGRKTHAAYDTRERKACARSRSDDSERLAMLLNYSNLGFVLKMRHKWFAVLQIYKCRHHRLWQDLRDVFATDRQNRRSETSPDRHRAQATESRTPTENDSLQREGGGRGACVVGPCGGATWPPPQYTYVERLTVVAHVASSETVLVPFEAAVPEVVAPGWGTRG